MKSPILFLFSLVASALFSSCATPVAPPQMAETSPSLINKDPNAKTYALTADWHSDGWVIKKGTMISFHTDGTGILEATVYDETTPPRRSRVHLFSDVYGADGNGLFKLPNSDGGHILHVHGTRRDCIHTIPFAYDARYYPSITNVRFRAGRDEALGITTPAPTGK